MPPIIPADYIPGFTPPAGWRVVGYRLVPLPRRWWQRLLRMRELMALKVVVARSVRTEREIAMSN